MGNINRVVLTGGLTRDPELRETPAGASVTTLRLAFATLRRIDGEWQERPNYIDVELWGRLAENAVTHLSKGRQIAVDGRLEWSEFESASGTKIQLHKVVADSVQYMGGGGNRDHSRSAQGSDSDELESELSVSEASCEAAST